MNLEELRVLLTAALDRVDRVTAEADRTEHDCTASSAPAEPDVSGEGGAGDGGACYPRSSWLV